MGYTNPLYLAYPPVSGVCYGAGRGWSAVVCLAGAGGCGKYVERQAAPQDWPETINCPHCGREIRTRPKAA